jgi:hypothetical protein
MDARPGSGKKISRTAAFGILMGFAGVATFVVWLIADDEDLTLGDIATPAFVGAAIGLVLAVIVIVLAVSRFRVALSRMRTPSVLLLGGLGLWIKLLLPPTILIGFLVGGVAWFFTIFVLGWALEPRFIRRSEQQEGREREGQEGIRTLDRDT